MENTLLGDNGLNTTVQNAHAQNHLSEAVTVLFEGAMGQIARQNEYYSFEVSLVSK